MNHTMLRELFRFSFSNRRMYFTAAMLLLAIIVLDFALGGKLLTEEDSFWNGFLDPVVGLGTLFTAFAVWWGEMSQDWRDNLPKRLTVDFLFNRRRVMRCENAYLAGESDIRALSMQIGAQMVKAQLDFKAAFVKSHGGEIRKSEDGGFELHYRATFELTKLPEKLEKMSTGQYLSWCPPFDEVEVKLIEEQEEDAPISTASMGR
ncbi:hypothetical protein [Methylocaldum sp. 14B]|jgi:hypothetical protein|uniref:hypothetical protein n=1 Tax=unclassified Methylocaldum TaxID=2622260 RepID=UPI000989FFF3|nr:hypothetical protein [Methylocaldum sp. 14B]